MDVHLQVLILTEVEGRITVDGLRFSLRQVLDHHTQGLLVGFGKLWLRRVSHTRDAWWHNIVDGAAVVVLLDVHGTDFHRTTVRGTCQRLIIDAPFATHQIETSEA